MSAKALGLSPTKAAQLETPVLAAQLPLEWPLDTLVVADPCIVVDAAPALVGEYKSPISVATGPHS